MRNIEVLLTESNEYHPSAKGYEKAIGMKLTCESEVLILFI